MTMRTTSLNITGRTTRNSRNANITNITFGRCVGSHPVTTPRHNSDHTAMGSHDVGDNPDGDDLGDENHGGGQGNENPGEPNNDPPDNDPSDQSDNPDDSDDDVQHNLADVIAALA